MNLTVNNAVLSAALKDLTENTDRNRYTQLFIRLVSALRPENGITAEEKVAYLIERLESNKQLQAAFQKMIAGLLNQKDCFSIFTRTGILSSPGFFPELFQKLKHIILPPLPDKRSLEFVIRQAFNKKNDFIWVNSVPDNLWVRLFGLMSFDMNKMAPELTSYLTNALTVLSYRVSSLGLEEEIHQNISSDTDMTSPFLEQNAVMLQLIQAVQHNNQEYVNQKAVLAIRLLHTCNGILQTIRKSSQKYGTSLSQTYLLVRTEQQITRMLHIISLLTDETLVEAPLLTSVRFFKEVVESENKRNSVRELVRKNTGLVAYQIAEHKGNTGEHYITTTRKEYWLFLLSAAGGGAIISFIALFKTLLHHADMAPFWEYFVYGLNYAVGFVLLQITHTTLATKQPAMTASTLAAYLDERKQKKPSLQNVAYSFVLVWRSQTASFIGNLAVVFPLSWVLAYLYELAFGEKLITPGEAQSYLDNQNPLVSLAWLYACITGIFLFVSGIISGYVDNLVRFRNIPGRVRAHPLLKIMFKPERRNQIAAYIDGNLGGFAGNIALGFFLGFAPLIGKSLGLPFDIRHITISTANFAFGIQGLNNNIHWIELSFVIIGVLGIGFLNFLVSFGLAFWVAMRSRGMKIRSYISLFQFVGRYFRKYPFDFFWPPKTKRNIEAIFNPPASSNGKTKSSDHEFFEP